MTNNTKHFSVIEDFDISRLLTLLNEYTNMNLLLVLPKYILPHPRSGTDVSRSFKTDTCQFNGVNCWSVHYFTPPLKYNLLSNF